MSKPLLGRLALATMPALIMLTAMTASPARAVTEINACQVLDQVGETYRVAQNLTSSCGTSCLVVANDRITIDLQGHQISADCFPFPGAAITDAGMARDGIAVKNGTVAFYIVGIDLRASSRTTVRNVEAFGNGTGIAVGSQSLVKDCHVHGNISVGIVGRDRVQVQGCDVSENGSGILLGDRCLVTNNVASDNRLDGLGISVQERCTVGRNVANGNGFIGIAVGPKSLVTSNVANNNDAVGIAVSCPSTVTNNTATGNNPNYFFEAFCSLSAPDEAGCHTKNNN